MPTDNRPPPYDTKVSKYPLPGAHNKPGVVMWLQIVNQKNSFSKSCMTKANIWIAV